MNGCRTQTSPCRPACWLIGSGSRAQAAVCSRLVLLRSSTPGGVYQAQVSAGVLRTSVGRLDAEKGQAQGARSKAESTKRKGRRAKNKGQRAKGLSPWRFALLRGECFFDGGDEHVGQGFVAGFAFFARGRARIAEVGFRPAGLGEVVHAFADFLGYRNWN